MCLFFRGSLELLINKKDREVVKDKVEGGVLVFSFSGLVFSFFSIKF